MDNYLLNQVKQELQAEKCICKEQIKGSQLCSFKSGGTVSLCVYPNTKLFCKVLKIAKQSGVKYGIVGNMSNTLIDDSGFDGMLICSKALKGIYINGNRLYGAAGESLSSISGTLLKAELGGGEFLCGIPALLGGAVCMNCGAYGGQICDLIDYVDVCDTRGIKRYKAKELSFGYRNSQFKKMPYTAILGVQLKMQRQSEKEIKSLIDMLTLKRKQSQPNLPSLGSVFKKCEKRELIDIFPDVYKKFNAVPAAVLIEHCNLKGLKVGGAAISDKHCNFIVNIGGASSNDYLMLVDLVKRKVYNKYNVFLEEEFSIL